MAHLLREADRVAFKQSDSESVRNEKAGKKFLRLYAAANGRALVLGRRTYPLMTNEWESKKRHRYKVYFWQLPSILRELRPNSRRDQLENWETELIDWGVKRGEDLLRKRRLAVA